jgi:beta-xylosidase
VTDLLHRFRVLLRDMPAALRLLFADYSDPDVIREGDQYYLVASSFHLSPGLPILRSPDLVHWTLVGHALPRLPFGTAYDMQGAMRYGGGVWAPAVRFHAGLFYLYFPTPAEGIFVITAPHMTGPWSEPVAVLPGAGYEDPCPFWDDDGQAYLVHSRTGAGPLILHRMSPDGKHLLDAGRVIVKDPQALPTLEGPKFYKRNGWFYIFAPMGGVSVGAQAVLRSRNVFGPYEHRIVLAQGSTRINGPHQGAYVETPDGKGWFVHFQSRGAHGRIVHLEPVLWVDDWPVMGEPSPGSPIGQPVASGPLPLIVPGATDLHIATSDEFSEPGLSSLWEWNHNPDAALWSLSERPGYLRLHAPASPDLLHARNTLTETMQDESLRFTSRLELGGLQTGDRAGVSLFDRHRTQIAVERQAAGLRLLFSTDDHDTLGPALNRSQAIQLRFELRGDSVCYSYSMDEGATFTPFGSCEQAQFSWWKGARPALFSFHRGEGPPGFADFDWAHYQSLP